jgi:hypothetical protein
MARDGDIIKRWTQLAEQLEKRIENMSTAMVKEIRLMEQSVARMKIAETQHKQTLANNRSRIKLQDMIHKQENLKWADNEKARRQRAVIAKELDDHHAENVRRNIRLRHSFEGFEVGLTKALGMLGGITPMGAGMIGMTRSAKLIETSARRTQIGREKSTLASDISMEDKNIRAKYGITGDMDANSSQSADFQLEFQNLKEMRKTFSNLTTELKDLAETDAGKTLDNNKNLAAMAKKMEVVANWASRNKGGILLSTISIGLLIGAFKKLLSVSPMLQKMLEVMNLAFNLVLRPFGDFIGFILRPIAMMMLSTVMPFFKEAYPFLMKLGTEIGEKLAKGDILGALGLTFEAISPLDVLAWIFGQREGNIEGAIGATGAALGVGGLGLAAAGGLATKKVIGRFTGRGGGGGGSSGGKQWTGTGQGNKGILSGNSGGTSGRATGGRMASISKRLAGIGIKMTPKIASMAAMFGGRAALKAIPIAGWAMLGAEVGLAGLKAINPEAYEQLRQDAEFMGIARDLILPEHTILEGYGLMDQLGGGSATTESSGGVMIQTNIGAVNNNVDVNDVGHAVSSNIQKETKAMIG